MPETANRATSAATARSHIDTSWQPAAVAMPCTRAMTGCGMRVMVEHQFAALPEQRLHEALVVIGAHFLEVVAGAEGLAGAGDDDDAHGFAGGDVVQFGLQCGQHVFRQRIELARAVQGQRGQAVGAVGAQDEGLFENHCGSPCSNETKRSIGSR